MKQLSFPKAALALLAPATIIVVMLTSPIGCSSNNSSPIATATGNIEVGFVDTQDSVAGAFQQVVFNVTGVRVNPSTDPNVSDADPNWITIPAPTNFSAVVADVQLDLTTISGQSKVFNTAPVPAQTYNQVEILLDTTIPGDIVPVCPQAAGVGIDGCIAVPITIGNIAAGLRTTIQMIVGSNNTILLPIDITAGEIVPPTVTGGSYTVSPMIMPVAPGQNFFGVVSGSVTGQGLGGTVTAELSGTNTIISSAMTLNGQYALQLPAGQGTPGAIVYDLYASSGGSTIQAAHGISLTGGQSVTQNFAVSTQAPGSVTGTIVDACNAVPIQAATLNLLMPSVENPSAMCTTSPPDPTCVVVGTALTDDGGTYPLANLTNPFSLVPIGTYGLTVSAAGYDGIVTTAPVTAGFTPAVCTPSPPNSSTTDCSFGLSRAALSGAVSINTPPPALTDMEVLVMAEDHGTNNIENVTLATIPSGLTSISFQMNVPTMTAAGGPPVFDLIASAVDLFQGQPDPFTGHILSIVSGVAGSSAMCATVTISPPLPPLECAGHGSVTGLAINPTTSTRVRIALPDPAAPQNAVQLMETRVAPTGAKNAGMFSFCQPPADANYIVTRLENGSPVSSATIAIPTPSPIPPSPGPSPLPTPTPLVSPCPSVCSLTSTTCPGPCFNQMLPMSLPP